jgi:hypothetical protein
VARSAVSDPSPRTSERLTITDRGRPVALLGPVPESSPLERLRAAGDVRPAVIEVHDLPEPVASAIHLATAQLLGDDLRQLVTYEARLAEAAARLGIAVVSPH